MKCRICESRDHTAFRCRLKQFKPIPKVSKKRLQNPVEKKPPKPINKIGKKAKAWRSTSSLWKKENPPDYKGFWYCKIGNAPLSDKGEDGALQLNLCHDISRARNSKMANELSNIFPGCQRHNREQGSKSLQEYLSTNYAKTCGNY